jgi:arylsulfatase A
MNKIRTAIQVLSLLFIGLACSPAKEHTDTAGKAKKPNIIYIVADDLGYGDLGCYGQQKFKTPHLDQLAAGGKLFTQHYAGSTVCAPSRSALMTGLHTGHTYVRGNRGINQGQYPLPDSARTLPKLLKKAGYVTGAFGKWGLGFPGSAGDPLRQGFDEFFGYNSQTIAHNYYPWDLWHNAEKVVLPENEGEKQGTYAPQLIHEKTLAFLEQHKDTTFFLFVPSIVPHAELVAPAAYMAKFGEKSTAKPPQDFKSVYPTEKPYRGVDHIQDDRFKTGGYGSQANPRAAFAAMVTLLDDQVGEIMAKVKELGLEENTLIIFTSDNGPHQEGGADPDFFNSNGPFKGYKRDLYEGGIRVPMIARWPGMIQPGTTSDHISAFWDVMPTICELASIETPAALDGISFVPALLGKKDQQQHAYLYWEFHEQGRKQAVRKGNWKGIRVGLAKDPAAPLALYNLKDDPGEERNVAAQHPELVREMQQIMQKEHTEDPVWPFFQKKKPVALR